MTDDQRTIRTIDTTAGWGGKPVWYTTANFRSGVSHLYVQRDTVGLTTLCGLSNEPGTPSQTAKHCTSCTARLRSFFEAALVEHEWVRETVTVTMVRPVTQNADDTVRNKVATAVGRKTSWELVGIEDVVEPYTPGLDCTCETHGIGKPPWDSECPVHGKALARE